MLLDEEATAGAGGGEVTYAAFAPGRTSASITLSNENLTAGKSSLGTRSSFLDVDLDSGIWSAEFSLSQPLILNNHNLRFYPGMGLTAQINPEGDLSTTYNTSIRMEDGRPYVNGSAGVVGYYDPQLTGPILMVFDADANTIGAADSGAILMYGPLTRPEENTLTPGISLWASTLLEITVNSGQAPFSAANEALLAAYEAANEVSINRGVWS